MSARSRLLLVEDHLDSRNVFTRLLARHPLDVRAVGTLREAVALLDWQPQILLLDLMLPDGSGLEIALAARQRGLNSPIAFVTVAIAPPIQEAAPLNVTWFQKPPDFPAILRWIDHAIAAAQPQAPRPSVLVVDDYDDTRTALIRLLRADGYDPTGASTADEALRSLHAHKPNLLLLDYNLPGMTGLELLRLLRQDPRLADLPVIMFTAYDGPFREQALAEGVDAYILKASLDWAQLRTQVRRLAGPATPLRTAPTPAASNRKHGA